ncbi:DUF6161 domain-containing protein [Ochrobactrum vermis]|uniref:DUF6161 domain-containing protein n=1 Tax=Ochrobactrum vermis TaxID=1827297 RepID=A0ABU8PI37_9HYPH|nr:DUF6161 domain-containing protein [Ochrobactrum vermis]
MKESFLEVDFGRSNGSLSYDALENVVSFLDQEMKFLNWLGSAPVQGNIDAPWSQINHQFNQINKFVRRDNSDERERTQLKTALEQAFRGAKIPLSTSPVGSFINELRTESPIAAAAALTSWMNLPGLNWSNYEHIKGAILMVAFDEKITSKAPAAVQKSLEKLHQKFVDARENTESETQEQRQKFDSERVAVRSATALTLRQARQRSWVVRKRTDIKTEAAIKSIQETEALYREHMRLKAPVEYWKKKSKTHFDNAASYRRGLLWFSVPASLLLLGILSLIARHAVLTATADKPAAVYLTLVTMGIVATTIVFWAARIIIRLFLSEHHLAIDAEERAVMTETYLALTASNAATEEDRAIILTTLFRPTADGIVKDDAGPDLSPASLLSRIGTR